MVLFARLLRVGGLVVTPGHIRDWLTAVGSIDITRRRDFKNATRAVLVHSEDELPWFDAAFDLFWQARDPRELEELELGILVQRQTERSRRAALEAVRLSDPDDAARDDGEESVAAYSATEALRRKDFAQLDARETAEVREMISRLRLRLETRRTRRRVPRKHGPILDLRRSLRRSLRYGGELVDLARRDRKLRRRPLVVLCDVSGSMEPYARLLLHFVYAVFHRRSAASGLTNVEAFVFGTRLTRITRQLRERDVDRALTKAGREVLDWGGGTRTGDALKEFNYTWGRRVLGRGAIVVLISDGWDRGDIDLLAHEIERLHQSCHRLVWLNPLLGSPRYQPLTRGMQAALPFLDDFLPVHNLRSLEQLGALLESLPERSDRRQVAARYRDALASA